MSSDDTITYQIQYLSDRLMIRQAWAMRFLPIPYTTYLVLSPFLQDVPDGAITLSDCRIRHPCNVELGYGIGQFSSIEVQRMYDALKTINHTRTNVYVILFGQHYQYEGILLFPLTAFNSGEVTAMVNKANAPKSFRQIIHYGSR